MSHPLSVKKATVNDINTIVEVLSPDLLLENDEKACIEMAEEMVEEEIVLINYLGRLPVGVIAITDNPEDDGEKADARIIVRKGFDIYKPEILNNLEWQALTFNFNQVSLITMTHEDEDLLKKHGYKESTTPSILDALQRGGKRDVKEYTKSVINFGF